MFMIRSYTGWLIGSAPTCTPTMSGSHKRVTNRMVAEALLARFQRAGVVRSPGTVTGNDLDFAYDDARQAVGNPLPDIGAYRIRGIGPRSLSLAESRHDKVLELYAALLKNPG